MKMGSSDDTLGANGRTLDVDMTDMPTHGLTDRVVEGSDSRDIMSALENAGHMVSRLSNGLIVAARITRVRNTRAVHLSIVHVLDLRNARFGKTGLALQFAVLELVTRSTQLILRDLQVAAVLENRLYRTASGSISIPLLSQNGRRSLVCETRTNYVVYDGARPTTDYSWFTDEARIVSRPDFALILQSDMRALSAGIQNTVDGHKWSVLEKSMKGWYGVVGVGLTLLGFILQLGTRLRESVIPIPLMLVLGGAALAVGAMLWSRRMLVQFREHLQREMTCLTELGDSGRNRQAVNDNSARFKIMGDLSFVISPLATAAAERLEAGNVDGAVMALAALIDECVRLSPGRVRDIEGVSGDEGLEMFVGLFTSLGLSSRDDVLQLALLYVSILSHPSTPVTVGDLLNHMTTLTYMMYDTGILSLEARQRIDEVLDRVAAHSIVAATITEDDDPDGVQDMSSTLGAIAASSIETQDESVPKDEESDAEE